MDELPKSPGNFVKVVQGSRVQHNPAGRLYSEVPQNVQFYGPTPNPHTDGDEI